MKVEKVIVHPHPAPDQQQNLTKLTSRGSAVAPAYRVWSTSVNAFMSNPTHRQTDRQTDGQNERSRNSAKNKIHVGLVVIETC